MRRIYVTPNMSYEAGKVELSHYLRFIKLTVPTPLRIKFIEGSVISSRNGQLL